MRVRTTVRRGVRAQPEDVTDALDPEPLLRVCRRPWSHASALAAHGLDRDCHSLAPRRRSEAGALSWWGQTARATRGRDLLLNIPFPREPPDLLMAESPPKGGLSAFNGPAVDPSC